MEITTNQIRKDLRFIKDSQKAINTYIETEEHYRKRLDWLSTKKQSDNVIKDITNTKQVLDKLELKTNIDRLSQLEQFYINAINKLDDEYDRLAILKVYMQGKTYYRVCTELHYSFDGLKKKIKKAVEKLKIIIEKM